MPCLRSLPWLTSSGESDVSKAGRLGTAGFASGKRRSGFIAARLEGLMDRPLSGKPPEHGPAATRNAFRSRQDEPPPESRKPWDGKALPKGLNMPDDRACRVLRAEGTFTRRKRG